MSTSQIPTGRGLAAAGTVHDIRHLVTDVDLCFCTSQDTTCDCVPDSSRWRRVDKDLYLHATQQAAWLLVAEIQEENLTTEDLMVTDVRVGKHKPPGHGGPLLSGEEDPTAHSRDGWEKRPGGIWVARRKYPANDLKALAGCVADVDVLFGVDAVDPRLHWNLLEEPLQLPDAEPKTPELKMKTPVRAVPRLTIQHSSPSAEPDEPRPQASLHARGDGTFKIVQISDTHMVTGVGVSRDALDAHGQPLPPSEADPLTVEFVGAILDEEKPDLVLLTGDQLHHDIHDSQSALFKIVAPLIERRIPWAAVFGNHDEEGKYALSREAQMSLLQQFPFSLCQPGPEDVDGVGNYYLSILPHRNDLQSQNEVPVATLHCLDSHGEISSKFKNPDYDSIKQSQIDWFTRTSQSLRKGREGDADTDNRDQYHLSLAFLHIPLPEYGDESLMITAGHRGEPTEGPSHNSHFYDALFEEGVVAVGCGHDHVNDFCGLLPRQGRVRDGPLDQEGNRAPETRLGPWLCYGGGSGFGGYSSYDGLRSHRRARVWELDTKNGGLQTWKRVEYSQNRVDEVVLVKEGKVCVSLVKESNQPSPYSA